MTINPDPQPGLRELDLAKLLSDDEDEWHLAYDQLIPVAKNAAKVAVADRTEPEMLSIAYEAIVELKSKLPSKEGDTVDLKSWVAAVAYRRSIDLWRKDTGARRKRPGSPASDTMQAHDTPEYVYESAKKLQSDDGPMRDPEVLSLWKSTLTAGLEKLENTEPKLGKLFRALIEGYYLGGRKIRELAQDLEIPMGSVGTTKQRALDRFKEIIVSDRRGQELMQLNHK